MPNRAFYDGLSLAGAIRRLADHHYEPDNRHISRDEYELLLRAAAALDAAAHCYELFQNAGAVEEVV